MEKGYCWRHDLWQSPTPYTEVAILDAGCGQAYLAWLLAKQGARVTGIEPADAFFTYALRREQTEPLGIHYLQADLSTWTPTPTALMS